MVIFSLMLRLVADIHQGAGGQADRLGTFLDVRRHTGWHLRVEQVEMICGANLPG